MTGTPEAVLVVPPYVVVLPPYVVVFPPYVVMPAVFEDLMTAGDVEVP